MIYSNIYSIADPAFITAPIFGERRASAVRSGYIPPSDPIPFSLTLARAQVSSRATLADSNGVLRELGANEPRFTGAEVLSQNLIVNPRAEGAVVGTSLPTGWTVAGTGVTATVTAIGTLDGVPSVTIRYQASSAPSTLRQNFMVSVALAPGSTYTVAATMLLAAGTLANVSFARIALDNETAAAGNITLTASAQRVSRNVTVTAATANRNPCVNFTCTAGQPIDFSVTYAGPQLEIGTVAGPVSLPPVGVQRTSTLYAATPKNLLIEGQRTNNITNPRAEGAVAGSPGTLPTNWDSAATALTREVVGVARVNGVTCLLVRFSGTPSSTGAQTLNCHGDVTTTIGTTWVGSVYVGLFAGSLTNTGGFVTRLRGGGADSAGISFTPTTTLTRFATQVRTLTESTAVSLQIRWAYSDTSTPVDFTLAIGWPQLEQNNAVSTPVLPPGGTLAASTVGGDNLTFPTSALETDDNRGGTHTFRAIIAATANEQSGAQTFFSLNDGTTNNSIEIYNAVGTSTLTLARTTAGVTVETSLGTFTPGQITRIVLGLDGLGRASGSVNNGVAQAVTGAPVATTLTTARLGSSVAGARPIAMEVLEWAHIKHSFTDDTLRRL